MDHLHRVIAGKGVLELEVTVGVRHDGVGHVEAHAALDGHGCVVQYLILVRVEFAVTVGIGKQDPILV